MILTIGAPLSRIWPSEPPAWKPTSSTVVDGLPEMVFQMVADAARIAHAAGRNDNVKAGKHGNGLAVIHRFGAFDQR